MVRTYSNNKKIYSVDMILAHLNMSHHRSKKIRIKSLSNQLKFKGWGDPSKKIFYSPIDVIANPKKYAKEIDRINAADLSYPIVMHRGNIIDGIHRLTKAHL